MGIPDEANSVCAGGLDDVRAVLAERDQLRAELAEAHRVRDAAVEGVEKLIEAGEGVKVAALAIEAERDDALASLEDVGGSGTIVLWQEARAAQETACLMERDRNAAIARAQKAEALSGISPTICACCLKPGKWCPWREDAGDYNGYICAACLAQQRDEARHQRDALGKLVVKLQRIEIPALCLVHDIAGGDDTTKSIERLTVACAEWAEADGGFNAADRLRAEAALEESGPSRDFLGQPVSRLFADADALQTWEARKRELEREAYASLADPRPLVWSTYRSDMRTKLVDAICEHEAAKPGGGL